MLSIRLRSLNSVYKIKKEKNRERERKKEKVGAAAEAEEDLQVCIEHLLDGVICTVYSIYCMVYSALYLVHHI